MKTYLDCVPCFFKQALEAARFAGADRKTQRKILNELSKAMPALSLAVSPPEMGRVIYGLVKKFTGRKDPFKKAKDESNRLALGIYDTLKKKVSHSHDGLLTSLELAIAGNIIDYGVKNSLDVNKELQKILNEEHKTIKKESSRLFNYPEFKRALKKAGLILYLGDNAGEIVFDRVLIEKIKSLYKDKRVIYAVKEKPIINDALMEDAHRCGIDRMAKVVSSGLDTPGTVLSLCSKKFLKIYKDADMIISKGQGNFEALSEQKRPIFFLFMAKCPVVARHVGCNLGDIILLYNRGRV
ncbi:MAG: ARMT1-like domain-containing protein [Candidatus Omnitrophota bacterium]|nr:ARMT1-like domain-containing protein [Candidatus Omnitrophota bacterium]